MRRGRPTKLRMLTCGECEFRGFQGLKCSFQCYPENKDKSVALYGNLLNVLTELREAGVITVEEECKVGTPLMCDAMDFLGYGLDKMTEMNWKKRKDNQ